MRDYNDISNQAALPRINPRDELPLFDLPEAPAIEELIHLREDSTIKLPIAVGMDYGSAVKIIDLADSPNLLIAGSRVCYDSIVQSLKMVIYSLLMTRHPTEVKLILMDAHGLDFMGYEQVSSHYFACLPDADGGGIVSSASDSSKVMGALQKEIEERLKLFQKARCRSIEQYNEKFCQRQLQPTDAHHFLPYIVVVANEYAEFLSLSKPYKQAYLNQFIRVARIGKSAGIHLVFGTTYLLKDLLPRELADGFPSVMAYRVNSKSESKMLLMDSGPEALRDTHSFILRNNLDTTLLHSLDVHDDEFDRVVADVGKQRGYQKSYSTPYYLPDPWSEYEDEGGGGMVDTKQLDERFEECARLVVSMKRGSTSDLQRRLGLGYAKAGRVMDQLEAAGIVGPQNGSKPREVLVKDTDELDQILSRFINET